MPEERPEVVAYGQPGPAWGTPRPLAVLALLSVMTLPVAVAGWWVGAMLDLDSFREIGVFGLCVAFLGPPAAVFLGAVELWSTRGDGAQRRWRRTTWGSVICGVLEILVVVTLLMSVRVRRPPVPAGAGAPSAASAPARAAEPPAPATR
jgi:hypothetical protein